MQTPTVFTYDPALPKRFAPRVIDSVYFLPFPLAAVKLKMDARKFRALVRPVEQSLIESQELRFEGRQIQRPLIAEAAAVRILLEHLNHRSLPIPQKSAARVAWAKSQPRWGGWFASRDPEPPAIHGPYIGPAHN